MSFFFIGAEKGRLRHDQTNSVEWQHETSSTDKGFPAEECHGSMKRSPETNPQANSAISQFTLPPKPHPSSTVECTCINCYFPGSAVKHDVKSFLSRDAFQTCCFPGCKETIHRKLRSAYEKMDHRWKYYWEACDHERTHYLHEGKYHCREEHCRAVTTSWTDLKRHYTSKHCKKPKKFPCPHFGCNRGGDNGFPRKDKLKSHIDNVHKNLAPGMPRSAGLQHIAPKLRGSA